MDPYIALIRAFAFNFAPQGWAQCNGQLLAIAQNQALFALLGTTYGGNGTVNFALPDLRGRYGRHFGSGQGLSSVGIGERSGTTSVTLTALNIPSHNHSVSVGVTTADGNNSNPSGNRLAVSPLAYNDNASPNAFLGGVNQSNVGQNAPINTTNPYLTVNLCIALVGIFPSRN